jgi:hypothetical protein
MDAEDAREQQAGGKGRMTHTPGPWAWRDFGGPCLVADHGSRLIVLDCGETKTRRRRDLRIRNADQCVMVSFDATHPDARLIAAAPELLKALIAAVARLDAYEGEESVDLRATIAKAAEKA